MTRSNDIWQVISSSNAFLRIHFFPSISSRGASSSNYSSSPPKGVCKDNVLSSKSTRTLLCLAAETGREDGGWTMCGGESLIAGGGGGRGVNNVSYSVTCDQFLEYLIVCNECLWHYLIYLQLEQLSIKGNIFEVQCTLACRKRRNVGGDCIMEAKFLHRPSWNTWVH